MPDEYERRLEQVCSGGGGASLQLVDGSGGGRGIERGIGTKKPVAEIHWARWPCWNIVYQLIYIHVLDLMDSVCPGTMHWTCIAVGLYRSAHFHFNFHFRLLAPECYTYLESHC